MSIESSSVSDGDDDISLDNSRQWKDVEPDEEKISVICLACDSSFPGVSLMLKHCKVGHQVDLVNIKKQLGVYLFRSSWELFCPELSRPRFLGFG